MLVDAIDDPANTKYAGWPDRVYVIDSAGKIALQGGLGPGGFTPALRAVPALLDRLAPPK